MWSQPGKEPVWNLVGWWPVVWENGAGQAAQTSLWVETATREGTDGQGQAPVSGIGSRLGRAGHPRGKGKTQGSVQARQTLHPQPGGSSWAQQPDFLSLQQPGCLVRIASGLGRAHFAMGGVCL